MKNQLFKITLALASAFSGHFANAQTPGAALDFDGNSDLISVNHSFLFNFSNVLSIEAWINTTLGSENYITSKGNDSFFFAINGSGATQSNGKLSFFLNGVTSSWINGNTNVSDGNWHHVAVTYNNQQIKLYVDGVQDVAVNASGVAQMGTSQVFIGFRPLSPVSFRYFQGKMDELRFWSIARSQCEIQTYMNCEISNPILGLSANYRFNQGIASGSNSTSTVLIDATGANNGTLSTFQLNSGISNWVAPGGVASGNTVTANTLSLSITPSNSVICNGQSATLTAAGANFYNWSNNNSGTSISVSPTASTVYSVTGTNGECKGTASVQISVNECTGINETSSLFSRVAPNPFQNNISVILDDAWQQTTIQIMDIAGRVCFRATASSAEMMIDASQLKPGLYIISIQNGENRVVKKIVKE